MPPSSLANELLNKLGGADTNNLNYVLQLDNKNNDQCDTLSPSEYYDMDSVVKVCKASDQTFSTISLNIESINSKFNKLTAFIEMLDNNNCLFDAILIQETWLTDKQCERESIKYYKIPGYHTIPLGRKCGRKGGLLVYLNENYTDYYVRDFPNLQTYSSDWEGLFIDITHKHNEPLPNKITLANVYRPGRQNNSNTSIDRFLKPFSKIFNLICKENSTIITGGDFNLNLLKLTEREKFQEYFDLFVSNGSVPQITLPTRFSAKNATLIDQIFCRFSKHTSRNTSGIIVTQISDHLPCFSVINYQSKIRLNSKYIKIQRKGPLEMQAFHDEIKAKIEATHFENDLLTDPTINYNKLETIISNANEKCFPVKEVKFNKYKHKVSPWITFGILNSMKFRDKLYIKWKKVNSTSQSYTLLGNSYKSFCSLLQKTIRMAKSQYYHRQFENFKSNMKKTWTQINELLSNKKKASDLPKYFFDGNTKLTDNSDIANCFNNFFCNIGPSLANTIKTPPNKHFTDYLKQNILTSFSFETISPEFTLKTIHKLKSKSSSGHDGISSIQLKYISSSIVNILTQIINQSLCTGIVPNSLKIAKISPIYKKGDPHITDNYRPISLLPVISKVLEKVVFLQVYDYFVKNNLLYDSQYGFRKYHSTEYAALEFSDKVMANLDQGKLPTAVFLDLSKAFDTIDHSILIHKLHYYGIRGTSLNWFKSYLNNRKQYVQFEQSTSAQAPITTGVPQGSILGPLLFIIYMNDIAKVTNKFHFTLYADDTSLIEPICTFTSDVNNNVETSEAINKELNLITDWLCLNKLSLNAKKTKMMIFHHRQRKISNLKLSLCINNTKIEQVKEFNFLGIMLDECMTWNSHIQKISSKISSVNGTLSRLKKFLPRDILKTIYNALIQPHLNFGVLLWGKNVKRIHKLQKWAVRSITCSKYNAHSEPLFIELKLLKIQDIYKLTLLKFYFKYKNNLLPNYFRGMLDPIQPISHNYDTRPRDEPMIARPNSSLAKSSIRYSLPKAILNIPQNIIEKISTHSFGGFSQYVKQYCIGKYNPTCEIENCNICSYAS